VTVLYVYRCTAGNEPIEHFFPLGEAPDIVLCPDHDSPAKRIPGSVTFLKVPGGHNATYTKP
jgi:hypothetical protein